MEKPRASLDLNPTLVVGVLFNARLYIVCTKGNL